MLALRRLRVADDEPMAIEEAIFPAALATLLQNADLEHRSLHDTLVEGGHVPTMGRARLGAEAAGPDDAALLGVARRVAAAGGEARDPRPGRPAAGAVRVALRRATRYGLDVQFDVELPGYNGG